MLWNPKHRELGAKIFTELKLQPYDLLCVTMFNGNLIELKWQGEPTQQSEEPILNTEDNRKPL